MKKNLGAGFSADTQGGWLNVVLQKIGLTLFTKVLYLPRVSAPRIADNLGVAESHIAREENVGTTTADSPAASPPTSESFNGRFLVPPPGNLSVPGKLLTGHCAST